MAGGALAGVAKLMTIWAAIRAGLWFVPTLMGLAAVGLAVATLRVDASGLLDQAPWWLHSGEGADASDLLEALLGSLITMATLAISITMVVLTLAAGQLGPRLIRIFIADRRTQIPLGLFLSTIVYLLLVLRSLDGTMSEAQVPHLAVSVGTALVLACIGTLLFFVHHLSRSIVADRIIARVGATLDAAIADMLPDQAEGDDAPPEPRDPQGDPGALLRLPVAGYIQAIEIDRLSELMTERNGCLTVLHRPGAHLLPGGSHARIAPAALADDPEVCRAVADGFVMGSERTPEQDLEYALRQLVEIALRALSPGLNDEFTAIAAIDRLALGLCRILVRGTPQRSWRDEGGVLRLELPSAGADALVEAAFDQIRHAAQDHPAILMRLQQVLADLADVPGAARVRESLLHHVDLVCAAGRGEAAEPGLVKTLDGLAEQARVRLSRRAG